MTLIGYARVSTFDQSLDLQRDALREAGCERVFEDHGISGASTGRPQLDACLSYLRPGDTLVVWRLDRLGRSLKHLVEVVENLERQEVAFRSLTEAMDTSTPGGRLLFHVFGSLAEFERALLRERVNAGLAAARARGRRGGRPRSMTDRKLTLARSMRAEGVAVPEIAGTLGVSPATVYRALAEEHASA